MLSEDQAAFARQLNLRFIGEDPSSRRHHISFQAQYSLKNFVPDFERNSRAFFFRSRRPARQQILVIDEESAIVECGPLSFGKIVRDFDLRSVRRRVISPPIERIDAEEFLGELVDGKDGAPHVRTREHDSVASRRTRRWLVNSLNVKLLPSGRPRDVAGHVLVEGNPKGGRSGVFRVTYDANGAAENFAPIARQVASRRLNGCRLGRADVESGVRVKIERAERQDWKECDAASNENGP